MQTLFDLTVVLFCVTGYVCDLSISPTRPVSVDALVGSDVTLTVSHSGASQPVVTWFMEGLPIIIWTISDDTSPDVASDHSSVLHVDRSGSLTFRNVSLSYNGTYTVEMTKIGEIRVSATFDLFVYDFIKNVSLHTDPLEAIEGAPVLTFYYSTMQGDAREVWWSFNGVRLDNGPHYSISGKNLTINQPSRNDTGRYAVVLTNPFSSGTHYRNITVLYGPDMPVLMVSPTKAVFVSGDSLFLSCVAEGLPPPSATWIFSNRSIPASSGGTVNLTDVTTSQSGVYTCVLINQKTGAQMKRNITVHVYEIPSGEPLCSVQATNENLGLQFLCVWPGGVPEARLSFPGLSVNDSGEGNFSITPNDTPNLNGEEIICIADHPLIQTQCRIIPRGPVDFLPVISTNISQDEQTTVVVHCNTEASPEAVVHWFKDGHGLEDGRKYQISTNTSQLFIRDFNVSSTDLDIYTCTAINPLGSKTSNVTLLGPKISDSSIVLSDNRTDVTLKWDVPPTSIITGFDIQMKGPDLTGSSRSVFRTIQMMPGFTRTTNISGLEPKSSYFFRIIPQAGGTTGEQSEEHRVQPDAGLGSAVIAGISAPFSIILLLIVLAFIYYGKCDRNPRYPISRAEEKVICQSSVNEPHHCPPPEYRLQPPERLTALHYVNTHVRRATTV
ncbi:V-set and immunoglobulin domain-containing protein 10-like isoform X2 [Triplophysa dalaica]|uniref:V-set and immunoglobulin domain-containing protein 10-like isoform X2 n=1 Tax=Triplophysa dalaica TaxID=1582913 RepID=UPI0024DF5642|nr:V-set and immunoglobulin domain-containing protein 10-like isoform X2 [Triplophysa dalaica]